MEGDFKNDYKNKTGIYPLYFRPKLFYSRCPIESFHKIEDMGIVCKKAIVNGFTIVYPEKPVSILSEKNFLYSSGYRRFLIDLSFERPSKNVFLRLIKEYALPELAKNGYSFNFKNGLE